MSITRGVVSALSLIKDEKGTDNESESIPPTEP